MELKLYQYITKSYLSKPIDAFDRSTQGKIEAFNNSIGLDQNILESIQRYLRDYNRFLETIKKEKLTLRYYQILAFYYTEVFLRERNTKQLEEFSKNALAYWMATGSGKTIIMHLNILQFIQHNKGFKDLELIITTPGVNLIQQHEREVRPLIDYLNSIYNNRIRLTIDTTSALLNKPEDFFSFPEDKKWQRLILVDEAHIGLGSGQKEDEGEFLKLRRRLNIQHSFLFEYSATFHNLDLSLEVEYSKSIIYDYNYNLFYKDGYGKDFYFQKVSSDTLKNNFNDNLDLNLSVIEEKLSAFNKLDYSIVKGLFSATSFPDRPLIAFMGNTVNDKTREGRGKDDELSDISEIVNYLANLPEVKRRKYKSLFKNDYRGKLKLTRNPEADDEILLSFGTGDYWGIINVGNGLNYINEYKGGNIEKVTSTAVVISNIQNYLFENIDKPQSAINLLIGSRKFAEGWNCYRVSVIGLINLGRTKGNKIIQIFGRGVRLKGLKNDGKRNDINHVDDYFKLKNTEHDRLRKLETLCIFSLKRNYLETFTEAVTTELEVTESLEISVNPTVVKLKGQDMTFPRYSRELKIFKLSKTTIDVKKVFLYPEIRRIDYEYIYAGKKQRNRINDFFFSLDYRTSKEDPGINIRNVVKRCNVDYTNFVSYESFTRTVIQQSEQANIRLYNATVETSNVSIEDVLAYIEQILYKEEVSVLDFDFIESVNRKISQEFVNKVRNKINWHLNSSIYEYGEELKQKQDEYRGDFIDKYRITKSIKLSKKVGNHNQPKSEKELKTEIDEFTKTIRAVENALIVERIGTHIYHPLLWENKHFLKDGLKVVPDKLNDGEKKFIKDLSLYIQQDSHYLKGFDLFVMRNVESLKSIGIYLNDDSEVYYPDFIVWLVSKEKIHIIFIDPKGQMGTRDLNTDTYNEKITIADKLNNPTLPNIEMELRRVHKKEFVLNSFILLRDSSELGKIATSDFKKRQMIQRNILRLDWHPTDEKEAPTDVSRWVDNKTYLDWIFEGVL